MHIHVSDNTNLCLKRTGQIGAELSCRRGRPTCRGTSHMRTFVETRKPVVRMRHEQYP